MTPEQIQSLESAGFRVADAADFLGLTPAEAAQVDEDVNAIHLTPRDGERLAAALDDPPAPSPALMRAAERHDRLIDAPNPGTEDPQCPTAPTDSPTDPRSSAAPAAGTSASPPPN